MDGTLVRSDTLWDSILALLALLSFSFCASVLYLVHDLLDLATLAGTG